MEGESLGRLKTRHKLERKAWDKEKMALTKAAKKNAQALSDIVARETALLQRHAAELATREQESEGEEKKTEEKMDVTEAAVEDKKKQEDRKKKAADKREKREAKEAARADATRYEASAKNSVAAEEYAIIAQLLRKINLQIVEVAADGWCLFAACGHQLGMEPQKVRSVISRTMRENSAEYLDFFEGGSDAFFAHVSRIESSSEWGGEAEIVALTRALDCNVTVVASSGLRMFGEKNAAKKVFVSYHRLMYASGEHYNSVKSLEEEEEEEKIKMYNII